MSQPAPLRPAVTVERLGYNPSSWRQRLTIAAVASVAMLISLYLGLYQWGVVDRVWDPVFGRGTAAVLTSDLSKRMGSGLGLPDAVLGAWAYSTEVILSLAGSTRRWQFRPWLVLLFGIDVIPLGLVSVILVILQGVAVGAWCFLCLVTALISLVLIGLSYDEVFASVRYLARVWKTTRDRRVLWDVFWGRAPEAALAVARRDG